MTVQAELINFFNYGELIHYGPHNEEYDKLADDPELAVLEHSNIVISILSLVHLYFGFSGVIGSTIGLDRIETA
jgi:hypothetical protein